MVTYYKGNNAQKENKASFLKTTCNLKKDQHQRTGKKQCSKNANPKLTKHASHMETTITSVMWDSK